jgi:flavin reductase (DIM6/NTAB) family NADH-FMN oxidoreductase RutF
MQEPVARFRKVMQLFPTGVTVVTTRSADGDPYGLTVNSFTSVSLDPLLILVCLDNLLSGLEEFQATQKFAVNILAEDQEDLSVHFSTPGSDRTLPVYAFSSSGMPLIQGALASLECSTDGTFPGGDHTIFVGRVEMLHLSDDIDQKGPLVYYLGRYGRLGDF